MKFYLTGEKGALASYFLPYVKQLGWEEVDSIANADGVFHFGAKTNVDWCELNREEAWETNAKWTYNLTKLCAEHKVPMFYVSTDYVTQDNVYGQTKLAGECAIKSLLPERQYLIVRAQSLYGIGGKSWASKLLARLQKDESITASNRIIQPTYYKIFVKDFVEACVSKMGITSISSKGETSWCDFANKMKKIVGSSSVITEGKIVSGAKRPFKSVFTDVHMYCHWEEQLRSYLEDNGVAEWWRI